MALLTNSRRLHLSLLFAVSGLLATGCALLNVFGGVTPFAFTHGVHAKEGLECTDCHAAWDTADAPGMPGKGGCMLCHEEIDSKKPPDRRVELLFEGDSYKAAHVGKLASENVFSHKQHAVKPIECKSCHAGIDENGRLDRSVALRMRDCVACHREQNAKNECATCHRTLRTDVAPPSHSLQWSKLHGPTVRAHDTATASDCAMCHQESTCASCHAAEPPDNHGNYFRRRGHGLYARMDRQNCATCHRSDSCDACHKDTRPMNHTGSFGGSRSNHCLGCHQPLQANECITCHKGTPSHDLAPVRPPNHAPGMDCRQCHGVGQPLPHADNGDDCAMCHR